MFLLESHCGPSGRVSDDRSSSLDCLTQAADSPEIEERESILAALAVLLRGGYRKNKTVTNLIFLGDSVSLQLSRFLLCDLVRSGVLPADQDHLFSRSPNFTEFHFSSAPPAPDLTLRVHTLQINLPCVDRNDATDLSVPEELVRKYSRVCSSNNLTMKQAAVSHYTKYMTRRHTHPPRSAQDDHRSQSVIIWNYGLHVKPSQEWALTGMAQGLYEEAQRNQLEAKEEEIVILYRETTAQSFAAVPGRRFPPNPSSLSSFITDCRWTL
jgi:hypothetical protein